MATRSRPADKRKRRGRRRCTLERLEPRVLLARTAWTNPHVRDDMTGEGLVTPLDALVGINELNHRAVIAVDGKLPDRQDHPDAPYFDTVPDGFLTPRDVVSIINLLNGDQAAPVLSAALVNDTAAGDGTADDGLTTDPAIAGRATDPSGVVTVEARVNGGDPVEIATDATGAFQWTPPFTPGGDDDGARVVQIAAVDARGNESAVQVSYSLDTTPPLVTLLTAGGARRAFDELTGWVVDSVSGTTSLSVQVDGGSASDVPLGSGGQFTVPLDFAADGSDDGVHTVRIRATDRAGNVSAPVDWSMTIDTRPPVLTLLSPTEGATVGVETKISGRVDDASSITRLEYVTGAATAIPVAFDPADGSFDQQINLQGRPDGFYPLQITAVDEAGNTTTVDVGVHLDLPLVIDEISPADGSRDVGVTFRPQVKFNEPIEGSRLSGDNFYASVRGRKLDAEVVPAGDGMSAWLFPREPMPGATHVTVHVVGDTIPSSASGEALDADGDGLPGGTHSTTFTTVSVTPVPGTSLAGLIADPGPDRLPMTADDWDAGPDGLPHTADDVFHLPIEGVDVHLIGVPGSHTSTDSLGRFTLDGVPVGHVKVVVDGRTALSPPAGTYFPEMVMDAVMRPGVENLVMPGMREMYLPRLNQSILQPVDAATGASLTVTDAGAPELLPEERSLLQLEVPAGSFRAADGRALPQAQVGLSTVPPELVVDMLPPGVLQHTFDITIQAPDVAVFSTPAPLTFPNVFDAAPGSKLNFLSFDHTTGLLVIEGTATVSDDGRSVRTDPGTGITKPGWHGMTPPGSGAGDDEPPPEQGSPGPQPDGSCNEDDSDDESSNDDVADEILFAVNRAGQFQVQDRYFEVHPRGGNGEGEGTVPEAIENRFPWRRPAKGDEAFRFEWELGPQDPTEDEIDEESGCPIEGVGTYEIKVTAKIEGPLGKLLRPSGDSKSLNEGEHTYTVKSGPGAKVVLAGRPRSLRDLAQNGLLEYSSADFPLRALEENVLYGSRIQLKVEITGDGGAVHEAKYDLLYFKFIDATDENENDGVIKFEHTLTGVTRSKKMLLHKSIPDSVRPKVSIGKNTSGSFSLSVGDLDEITNALPQMFGQRFSIDFTPSDSASLFVVAELVVHWPKTKQTTKIPLLGPHDTHPHAWQDLTLLKLELDDLVADLTLPLGRQRLLDFLRNPDKPLTTGPGAVQFWNEVLDKVESYLSPFQDGLQHATAFGPTITPHTILVGPDRDIDALGDAGIVNVNTGGIKNTIARRSQQSQTRTAYELAQAVNHPRRTGAVLINVKKHVLNTGIQTAGHLRNALAYTIAHEIGHRFGLLHTLQFARNPRRTLSFDASDVMAQGLVVNGSRSFNSTKEAGFIGLGLDWSVEQAGKALDYYKKNFDVIGNATNAADEHETEPDYGLGDLGIDGGFAELRLESGEFANVVRFARQTLGADAGIANLTIHNIGREPFTLAGARIEGGDGAFRLAEAVADGTIAGGESRAVSVAFDPEQTGLATASLILDTDAVNGTVAVPLVGEAQAADARLHLDLSENRLPAIEAKSGTSRNDRVASIVNRGAAPLVISSIRLADATGPFDLTGVPADLETQPIVLDYGDEFFFGATFTPRTEGLLRGEIQIESNDPTSPVTRFYTTGTGVNETEIAAWGNDYVAIETPEVPASPVLRDITDDGGNFEFFLPADALYHIAFFDPQTGLVAHDTRYTAPSGGFTKAATNLNFTGSSAPDRDGDGLPDDVEFAVGSHPERRDTDGDGIDDFEAVAGGLDPRGGEPLPLGLVNILPLAGTAERLVIEASAGTTGQPIAYVATGDASAGGGLALVDVTRPDQPVLLSQITLPGHSLDVAVDAELGVAAVASTSGGVHLVDVSDASDPRIAHSLSFPTDVTRVEFFDGDAMVSTGGNIVRIDAERGLVLETLELTDGTVTDLARDGDTLFAMDLMQFRKSRVHAVTLADGAMVRRGSLELDFGAGQIFAGNGIVYAMSPIESGQQLNVFGGISTINAGDPDHLALISPPDNVDRSGDSNPLARSGIAVSDAGLAILAGLPFLAPRAGIDLLDVSDPSVTDNVVTRLGLPGLPRDLALAMGMAFVATGEDGLQVVNYQDRDIQGQAPAISLSSRVPDAMPAAQGHQIDDGSLIPLDIEIDEDVQTSRVDLLVNGRLAATDLSFPFQFSARAPWLTSAQMHSLQVRAVDTGGNTSLSNTLLFEVVPQSLQVNASRATNAPGGRIEIDFSKPIQSSDLTPDQFTLTADGPDRQFGTDDDIPVPLSSLEFNLTGDQMIVSADQVLSSHQFRLVVAAERVRDLAGNRMDGEFDGEYPTGNGIPGGDFVFDFFVGDKAQLELFAAPRLSTVPMEAHEFFRGIDSNEGNIGGNILVVDVNHDGASDILRPTFGARVALDATGTTSTESHQVGLLLAQPDGTLAAPLSVKTGPHPRLVRSGDFNADGHPDLVTVNVGLRESSGQATVPLSFSIVLGNGDGSFQPPLEQPSGRMSPRVPYTYDIPPVAVADFTGDGVLDLALLATDSVEFNDEFTEADVDAVLLVYAGRGDGTFQVPAAGLPVSARTDGAGTRRDLWAVDVNGDGRIDLVTPEQVLLNQNDGTFAGVPFPGPALSRVEFVGDLTGDGVPDAINVTREDVNFDIAGETRLFRGIGDGTFALESTSEHGNFGVAQVVYDVNLDGRLDLVGQQYDELVFSAGEPEGTFAFPKVIHRWASPLGLRQSIVAHDVNQDGRIDLIAGRPTEQEVVVLAGTESGLPATPEPAQASDGRLLDVNADGKVDVISRSGSIRVNLGNGDGSFGPTIATALPPNTFRFHSVHGDANADGLVDALALQIQRGGTSRILLYLGLGTGRFQDPVEIDRLGEFNVVGFSDVSLADVTGDGFADVVSVDPNGFRVRAGDGAGGFADSVVTELALSRDRFIRTEDVNHDQRQDVLLIQPWTSAGSESGLQIFLGNEDGTLSPQRIAGSNVRLQARPTTLRDVNNDGNLDVLSGGFGEERLGVPVADSLYLFFGNGDGTLQEPVRLAVEDHSFLQADAGDVDADGIVDVVYGNERELAVLLGDTDGTYRPAIRFDARRAGCGLMIDDFDGDDLLDVLSCEWLWRNQGTP